MEKKKILFVCLGNICRSPMAEGTFQKILEREGKETNFEIDSAGLISSHSGELPDARMRRHAQRRGYELTHRSRQVKREDFDRFDYIIGMDAQNIRGLKELAGTAENIGKIYRMTDFCQRMNDSEVPDPYYGGDSGFEYVIDLLEDSCEGLFKFCNE
ncbi:low molecular weight phosphotyrosine protein phosphatase [Paludibacter sp. 221]|uniref:low molecular weight protein-tyrosine-phosphatase n=1 Tax=Paludibacter sp. 221 TaxID=2302939 RepID=UPI0013D82CC7|nr:low molecular weight protein-tyrosine-phosphatase [Paludibacter sp. 221]NDV47114.1 low molecular weight phosphotyrosine protein phosphatase [Paludibacter sp. 221]